MEIRIYKNEDGTRTIHVTEVRRGRHQSEVAKRIAPQDVPQRLSTLVRTVRGETPA